MSSLFQDSASISAGDSTASHVRVSLAAQGGRLVIQVVATILLSRMLAPEDFGVVGMVSVVLNFLATFRDMGLGQATIQRKELAEQLASNLFWVNVAFAILLATILGVSSGLLAEFYSEPAVAPVALALSASVFLNGLAVQHRALLQRNLRFKSIALSDVGGALVGAASGLLSAKLGLGYWSIVVMHLMTSTTTTALVWLGAAWLPSVYRAAEGMREAIEFGVHVSGLNLLNFFARNSDSLLIGRYLGAEQLGFYNRAYSLVTAPVMQVSGPIRSVLFPSLSRLHSDPDEFSRLFCKYACLVAWLTAIPISAMTIFGAELIVTLLGERWLVAGEVFELLCYAAILQPVASMLGVAMLARGKTGVMLAWEIFASTVLVSVFVFSVSYGIHTLAIAYAIAMNVLVPLLVGVAAHNTPLKLHQLLKSVYVPVLIAAMVACWGLL